MKKITKTRLALLTAFDKSTFFYWLKKQTTPEKKFRYDALMLGSTLMDNGYTFGVVTKMLEEHQEQQKEILQLKEKNEILTDEMVQLENEIHVYADKIEALRGIGK